MKYTVAWSNVISQNATLKAVVLVTSALSLFFGLSLTRLSLKDPLVIERGCFSSAAAFADNKRTPQEIESFLKSALSQRFDTTAIVQPGFLSPEEELVRAKEQKEMQIRKIAQRVFVNSVVTDASGVTVDADRLISVGEILSGFHLPLKVKLESTARTLGNPFGLLLQEVAIVAKGSK